MLTKNFCVFVINSNKHATVHSTSCPHVGKQKRGTVDPNGDWRYEEFDSVDDANKRWEELGNQGYPLKECQNKDCRMFRGLP